MESLLIYLVKVSVSAILFYLFIRILMERETQHEYIRGLWTGAMVVSVLLPFIYVPVPDIFPDRPEVAQSVNMVVSSGEVQMVQADVEDSWWPGWVQVLGWFYLAGVSVAFAGYVFSHVRLALTIRRIPRTHAYDSMLSECAEASGCRAGISLHVTDNDSVSPFSWMRTIVVCRRDMENDGRDIILHEMGHILRGHSWDVLLSELFTCLLWFNPVSWLMQYSLRQIHEYSADCTVLRSGADAKEYQRLLIRKAAGTAFQSIANSFNHSNLKNRITMMLQNQTGRGAYAKSLSLLPVLACLLLVFSAGRPAPEGKVSENSADLLQNSVTEIHEVPETVPAPGLSAGTTSREQSDDEPVPFQFVDVKPSFMGGDANKFSEWVMQNIVYPEEARSARISGRVTLKFTVNTDGSVSDVSVLRGVNKLLDDEAVRVVSISPAWTPGQIDGKPVRVSYTFPVVFMVDSGKDNVTGPADDSDVPDVYIDGKLATSEDLKGDTPVDGYIEEDGTVQLKSKMISSKEDFLKWANTLLAYPVSAKEAGKYGKVTVSFKLDSRGSVCEASVKASPDDALASEVLRVTNESPEWYKTAYQYYMVQGQGYIEYSVGFILKSRDASGNPVTLGDDSDVDIVVVAYI